MIANIETIQTVARNTRYINIGYKINDEILIFEINFIENAHYWGVTIVNPDGEAITRTAEYGKDIFDIELIFGELNLSVSVLRSEANDMYEIYFG